MTKEEAESKEAESSGTVPKTRVEPKALVATQLGWPRWIGVVSENLSEQRRFYREVLGLTEAGAGPEWVQFDLGEGRLLELVERSREPQYDRARCQVAFGVEDIESARRELIARGAHPLTEILGQKEGSNPWCYFRDPEGNVFALKRLPRS